MKLLIFTFFAVMLNFSLLAQDKTFTYKVEFHNIDNMVEDFAEKQDLGEEALSMSERAEMESLFLRLRGAFFPLIDKTDFIESIKLKDGKIIKDLEPLKNFVLGLDSDNVFKDKNLVIFRGLSDLYRSIDTLNLKNKRVIKFLSSDEREAKRTKIKSYKELEKIINAEGGIDGGGGD